MERLARATAVHRDEVDDLVQEGVVGLLKAIRRYEPGRGIPFEAYATTAIWGEIRHHQRDRSSCLRLPEPVRELRTRLRTLADEVRGDEGREPRLEELAERAGVTAERAVEAVEAGVAPLDPELPTRAAELDASEARVALGAQLESLEPRQQQVVYYRFFADLTQSAIAELLGISQMHVSRLLRSALEQMRATLDVE